MCLEITGVSGDKGTFEVLLPESGQVLHSKTKGDGFVDSNEKLKKICSAIRVALESRSSKPAPESKPSSKPASESKPSKPAPGSSTKPQQKPTTEHQKEAKPTAAVLEPKPKPETREKPATQAATGATPEHKP